MKKFGAYEILHELKSGGMGSVLLARRRGPGAFEQLVAIKTVRPELAGTPAVRAMFLDEAAILARINHPGIATVHDFGEEGGTLYMVMEYVAGIPFRDLIEHRPPPAILARAIAEACRGLHAAHELRDLTGHPLDLVHRDISPDNLMLGFDGHVKVIDFGIALVKKNRQAPVTEFGTVKGKPPYMSPEQVANQPMDRRSDIWALAVVMWELITQRSLFDGDSILAIALAVANQVITPPSQLAPEPLPFGLDATVMNALDRDLARRTPTAAALAEQLEQVIQHAGGESLEAWAERALAGPRIAHREWLANIIAGEALPKAVGRATGQVTEVAPIGQAKTQMAPSAGQPLAVGAGAPGGNARGRGGDARDDDPGVRGHGVAGGARAPIAAAPPLVPEQVGPTSIGGTSMDGLSIPPRRRLGAAVAILLVLLAAGGGAYVLLREQVPSDAARDARVDVTPVPVPVPADASSSDASTDALIDALIDAPVDAAIDAGTRVVTIRHDATRAHRDATIVVARVDAAVTAPASTGSGLATIKYAPGTYANISIDGAPAEPGPIYKRKLSAGKHTVKFLDPKTGAILDEQTFTIADGQSLEVRQK